MLQADTDGRAPPVSLQRPSRCFHCRFEAASALLGKPPLEDSPVPSRHSLFVTMAFLLWGCESTTEMRLGENNRQVRGAFLTTRPGNPNRAALPGEGPALVLGIDPKSQFQETTQACPGSNASAFVRFKKVPQDTVGTLFVYLGPRTLKVYQWTIAQDTLVFDFAPLESALSAMKVSPEDLQAQGLRVKVQQADYTTDVVWMSDVVELDLKHPTFRVETPATGSTSLQAKIEGDEISDDYLCHLNLQSPYFVQVSPIRGGNRSQPLYRRLKPKDAEQVAAKHGSVDFVFDALHARDVERLNRSDKRQVEVVQVQKGQATPISNPFSLD